MEDYDCVSVYASYITITATLSNFVNFRLRLLFDYDFNLLIFVELQLPN